LESKSRLNPEVCEKLDVGLVAPEARRFKVVANLPYIATRDWEALAPSVRDYEPQAALDSGPSGMELIHELATQTRYVLVPGGMLYLEFGYDQGNTVFQCLSDLGYLDIQIKHDLAGHDRIAIAENP
jgi:release factor glutamine methyltransferase